MQNRSCFLGGLVLVLGLAGCGAADSRPAGEGNDLAGAGGVEKLPRPDLVGAWRTSPGPDWRDYSEALELREDGTGTFTRRRDETARARAWIATYFCEWSVTGPARATTAEPWTLVQDCHRVSELGSANGDVVDLGSSFVASKSIIGVGASSFAIATTPWSHTPAPEVYERYAAAR
jgi:hypothetical protein